MLAKEISLQKPKVLKQYNDGIKNKSNSEWTTMNNMNKNFDVFLKKLFIKKTSATLKYPFLKQSAIVFCLLATETSWNIDNNSVNM